MQPWCGFYCFEVCVDHFLEEDDGGDGAGEGADEGVEVCEGSGYALGFVGALKVDVPCDEFNGGGEAGWLRRGGGYGLPFGAGEGVVGL